MATRAIIRVAEREEGVTFNEHPQEIRTTCTFLPDRYQPKDMLDLKYGDWLLTNK